MTWVVIVSLVFASVVKIAITSMPTPVVKWIVSRFAIHPELDVEQTIVEVKEKELEKEQAIQLINAFNKGTFLEKYYIYPGTEGAFLLERKKQAPIVFKTFVGKKVTVLSVFCYKDQVDVIKETKKNTVAYSLLSEELQSLSIK
ncbi:YfmQ family protein [Priestia filamentosa]|uniref:YfmQ family protein n=1 Tax=Priestia filamentosa TaxID=1402861 RepID=UPI003978CDEA